MHNFKKFLGSIGVICLLIIALNCVPVEAQGPLGSSLTYQGYLEESERPANGTFDIQFNLYDGSDPLSASLEGTVTLLDVSVESGYFSVDLDFGSQVFGGDERWLELQVRPANAGTFEPLLPLQKVTATPYALFALSGNEGAAGADGVDGATWFTGMDEPNDSTGQDDDLFLDTSVGDIYRKTSGSWSLIANITGPSGQPGADGSDGSDGSDGNDGAPGKPGPPGASPFGLNGSSAFYNAGSVGIGDSTPSYLLDVAGDINTTGAYRQDGSVVLAIEGRNVFVGSEAGRDTTASGVENVYLGDQAGKFNTSGDGNVFIGSQAGEFSTSSDNVIIGFLAGDSTSGNNNVFIGARVAEDNTSGRRNVFIGDGAGKNNTTGEDNIFVGMDSGRNNTTGSDNIYIGRLSGSTASTSDQLFIDNTTTSFPLIHGNFSSNTLTINGSLTVTGGCTGCSSDLRLKENIVPVQNALDDLLSLSTISYDWVPDAREAVAFPGRQLGLVAQEVEKVFPELVGTDDRALGFVRYQKLVVPLIAAVQEQQRMLEELRDLVCDDNPGAKACNRH